METNNYDKNILYWNLNLPNKYYVTNSKVWFPASQNFFQFFYVEFYDDCLEFWQSKGLYFDIESFYYTWKKLCFWRYQNIDVGTFPLRCVVKVIQLSRRVWMKLKRQVYKQIIIDDVLVKNGHNNKAQYISRHKYKLIFIKLRNGCLYPFCKWQNL